MGPKPQPGIVCVMNVHTRHRADIFVPGAGQHGDHLDQLCDRDGRARGCDCAWHRSMPIKTEHRRACGMAKPRSAWVIS